MSALNTTVKQPAHAKLGASSSHRWMHCPGSIRLSEGIPNRRTDYAAEGSAAHAVAYHLASGLMTPEDFANGVWTYYVPEDRLLGLAEADSLRRAKSSLNTNADFLIVNLEDDDMIRHGKEYADYIQAIVDSHPGAQVFYEVKLDFSEYIPGGFGTADCVVIAGGTVHVIDYKYGRGVRVIAQANSQLLLYALGAVLEYSFIYDISEVHLHVVQPRIGHFDSWSCTTGYLMDFAKTAREAALQALGPDAPINPGEEQCRFCPASGICPKQAEHAMAMAGQDFDALPDLLDAVDAGAVVLKPADTMTPDDLARLMPVMDYVEQWARDVQARVHELLLAGASVPGFKLVEGRSSRQWAGDETRVASLLTGLGVAIDSLYTRKLVSPAQAEKLVGRKQAPALADLIVKAPGKPSVVPESDKRPEYKPQEMAEKQAAADFGAYDPTAW